MMYIAANRRDLSGSGGLDTCAAWGHIGEKRQEPVASTVD